MSGLGDAFKGSSQLRHAIVSPAFGHDAKQAVLAALSRKLGCPPEVEAFLAQLIKKNRATFLPDIAEAFAALADQAKGTQPVTVTAARALNQSEQDGLRQKLKEVLRRDVDLAFVTDPAVIAGLQIRVGSAVYDSTVRTRLTAMKGILTKE